MALTTPITNPARSACHHSSIAKSSSTAASSHNVSAPATVTRMTRHTTTPSEGRSATGRSAGGGGAARARHAASGSGQPFAGGEDADVVEQSDAIELGAEPLDRLQQPRRRPAADDRRAVGPPVDRDDQPGIEDPHRLGGARGIEVALADASDPNPRSGAGRRPRARWPTSRRTGRCRRRSTPPGPTTAARSRRRRRSPCCADRAGACAWPARSRRRRRRRGSSCRPASADIAEAAAGEQVTGALRGDDGGRGREQAQRRDVQVVQVDVGDQDGVDSVRRARSPACRRRWATRPVSTGSVNSRTSPSSTRTVAWPTQVSCERRSRRHRRRAYGVPGRARP